MGSTRLTFDSITIVNKRSDHLHNDNDWMTIVWYVNMDPALTEVGQLAKADGDTSLDTGSVIQPFTSPVYPTTVSCKNGDVVTASFVVYNLGSTTDGFKQKAQAEEIGKIVAKGVADAYVHIAEYFVKADVPLGDFFALGIDAVRSAIVDSVGAAYDDIVKPAIEKVLHVFGAPPDCNGEVMEGVAVFDPRSVYPNTTVPPPYTVPSPSECGRDPHTSVILTQERDFDVTSYPSFPTTTWTTEYVPVHNRNVDVWLGSWAENPNSPYPIVFITVEDSKRASGLFSVHIVERVDPVQGVVPYETGADPISIHVLKEFAYVENVFGTVRPWVAHGVAPGNAHVFHHPIIRHDMRPASATGGPLPALASPALEPRFVLLWSRPVVGTPIKSRAVGFPVASAGIGAGASILLDETDAIDLPDKRIRLCLYEVVQNGAAIGNAIRYLRAESFSYTQADVMLFPWREFG